MIFKNEQCRMLSWRVKDAPVILSDSVIKAIHTNDCFIAL